MNIKATSNSPSFNSKFIINYAQNKNVKYLANHLSDFAKKEHVPATFSRDAIELNTFHKSQDSKLIELLKNLKANFKNPLK